MKFYFYLLLLFGGAQGSARTQGSCEAGHHEIVTIYNRDHLSYFTFLIYPNTRSEVPEKALRESGDMINIGKNEFFRIQLDNLPLVTAICVKIKNVRKVKLNLYTATKPNDPIIISEKVDIAKDPCQLNKLCFDDLPVDDVIFIQFKFRFVSSCGDDYIKVKNLLVTTCITSPEHGI